MGILSYCIDRTELPRQMAADYIYGETAMQESKMKPRELVLRCLAEKKLDQWQVLCLDLALAAQGDSFEDARQKLELMIVDYVYDAIDGEDRDYAEQLLNRRAPLRDWVKFYSIKARMVFGGIKDEVSRLFFEPIPMVPRDRCTHA